MAKGRVQLELSLYIRAENPSDLPLEIYDALYYSGRFDPIYRVQGDMVLSAYYNRNGRGEGRARKLGRRILKELTIDVTDRPKGTEVKVENLMPVFEEESSFYRDPKVRISTKGDCPLRGLSDLFTDELSVLAQTEAILLRIPRLKTSDSSRIVLTLTDGEFKSAEMREMHSSLTGRSIRSTNTRHGWSLDVPRSQLDLQLVGELSRSIETYA